jgi:hypothetical protein
MRTLIVLFISLLAGSSKSPMDTTVDGANAAATKLMAPLVQKDASHQVEGLIRTIEDRPVCRATLSACVMRPAAHPMRARRRW